MYVCGCMAKDNYDGTINFRTYKSKKEEYIRILSERGTDISKDLNEHINNVINTEEGQLLVQSPEGEQSNLPQK